MLFNDRRKGLGQLSSLHNKMSAAAVEAHAWGEGMPGGEIETQKAATKKALATKSGQRGSARRIAKGRKKDMKAGY